jgi:hypothetical protein
MRAASRSVVEKFPPRLTQFLNNLCYQREDWQHDAAVRTSDGVHPFVKIWYSPAVFNWMTVNQRKGPVPNGAGSVRSATECEQLSRNRQLETAHRQYRRREYQVTES